MTPRQIMDQIICCNENSTTVKQYGYVENIGDGMGYTCGWLGFTTADGDYLNVVSKYAPMNKFTSTSTFKLWLQGFPNAWKKAATDPAFQALQDAACDYEYFFPASQIARGVGISSNLGVLSFYDTIIQLGQDGLNKILSSVASDNVTSGSFLADFLWERIADMHQEGYGETVSRVSALQDLLRSGNTDLVGPFQYSVYGDTFTIGAP